MSDMWGPIVPQLFSYLVPSLLFFAAGSHRNPLESHAENQVHALRMDHPAPPWWFINVSKDSEYMFPLK